MEVRREIKVFVLYSHEEDQKCLRNILKVENIKLTIEYTACHTHTAFLQEAKVKAAEADRQRERDRQKQWEEEFERQQQQLRKEAAEELRVRQPPGGTELNLMWRGGATAY